MANAASSSDSIIEDGYDDCQRNKNGEIHTMANTVSSSGDSTIKIKKGHDDCQLDNHEIRISVESNDDDCNKDEITIDEEVHDDCNKDKTTIVESIEKKLEDVHSLQSAYDIYRIPDQLQKLKPEAYTPQSVSIGPLHYEKKHLKPMQAHKFRYLKYLLEQRSEITLDVYVKAVSKLEKEARECYSETMGLGKNEFIEMMVIDGCFILALLKKLASQEDYLLSYPTRHSEIVIDLIKLENQLPFLVLEKLHGLIFDRDELPQYTSSTHHILAWLLLVARGLHAYGLELSSEEVRSLPLPEGRAKHFLDLLRCALLPPSPRTRGEEGWLYTSCASELKKAGVQFQKEDSPKTSLFKISFNMDKGVLIIPTIAIFDYTEHILRNLIAFEQGQKDCDDYFSSYAAFMDGLIDTARDVELLVQKGIIENHLGSPEDVVNLFNNLVKHVTIRDACFSCVIKDVGDYQKKVWNKRKASLMQNHFNTPWALISFLAAVLLLILTMIQAICSILQVT